MSAWPFRREWEVLGLKGKGPLWLTPRRAPSQCFQARFFNSYIGEALNAAAALDSALLPQGRERERLLVDSFIILLLVSSFPSVL